MEMPMGTVMTVPSLLVQDWETPLLTQQIVSAEQVLPKTEDKIQVNPRRAPVSQQNSVVPLPQAGAGAVVGAGAGAAVVVAQGTAETAEAAIAMATMVW